LIYSLELEKSFIFVWLEEQTFIDHEVPTRTEALFLGMPESGAKGPLETDMFPGCEPISEQGKGRRRRTPKTIESMEREWGDCDRDWTSTTSDGGTGMMSRS